MALEISKVGPTALIWDQSPGQKGFAVPEQEVGAPSERPAGTKNKSRRRNNKRPASSNNPQNKRGRWRHVFAAVDLGTSNCRLLVARPTKAGFRVIDAFSRTVRLGEGVESSGQLSSEAMDRAVDALKICANKIRRRRVTRIRAIATEACRLAGNGMEFVDRVQKETGLQLDIIPTDEEARLAVAGCSTLLDRQTDGALIFDIGGGSTELVWLDLTKVKPTPDARTDADAIAAWTSLPLGVVNLAERYGGGDVAAGSYDAMVEEVASHLRRFEGASTMRTAFQSKNVHLLGTSGTVTTLAGIHLGLEKYERSKVDGVWIEAESVHQISKRLSTMTYDQRAAEPCVGHDRADLVVAGCAIFDAIYKLWPCTRLRVADRGLREGMLFALMDKADRERPRRRRRKRRKKAKASVAADAETAAT